MATTSTTQNDLTQIGELQQLYNLLSGGSSKASTVSTTKSSNVSQATANQYIENMLSGTSGLASIATGAKTSGLYGSSTQSLLTNKLLTDTAAKAAALNSSETTTTVTTPASTGNSSRNTALAFMAGKQLLGTEVGKKAVDKATDWVSSLFADTPTTSVPDLLSGTVTTAVPDIADYAASVATPAADYVSQAAATAGSSIVDFIGGATGWWADGGRVPKKGWADGGRVAGLRSSGSLLPTISKLGQYSYASQQSANAGSSTAAGAAVPTDLLASSDSTSIDGTQGTFTDPSLTNFGHFATSLISDMTGKSPEDAAALAASVSRGGLSTALSLAPGLGTLGALAGANLGPNTALAGAIAGKTADKGVMNQLFDMLGITAQDFTNDYWTGQVAKSNEGRSKNDLDTWETARSKAANEVDPNVLAEQDKGLDQAILDAKAQYAQNAEQGSFDPTYGGGYDTQGNWIGDQISSMIDSWNSSTDTTATDGPSGDSWGPGDAGASDAPGGGNASGDSDYNEGGRVRGDNNKGVDDVPVKLGPKAGGGTGMLDGGEVVIKAKSVDLLDQVLGKGFLDELNNNPQKFVRFLLARR